MQSESSRAEGSIRCPYSARPRKNGRGDLTERVAEAKHRFRKLIAAEDGHIDGLMRAALAQFIDADPSYLAHEHFSSINEPCSVSGFAAYAERHGLHFLSDAALAGEGRRESLARRADINAEGIERGALIDLLQGAAFRQTLLCRADRRRPEDGQIEPLAGMAVAAALDAEVSVVTGHAQALRVSYERADVLLRLPAPVRQ